jgi:4-hydroxy-tetrahydrodipicolinate synthase
MCYKYFEGNVAEASKMQLNAIDLVEALFCETNPIPVKHAMNLMNMNVGPLRKPLVSMSTAHLERLRNSLKLFGLLG